VRIFAACAVLVAAFLAALLIGRAGGDSAGNAGASAEVKTFKPPESSVRPPQAHDPGTIPNLQPKPQVTSTPSTGSTPTAENQSSTPTEGSSPPSSGGGGGGGGSTPTVRGPG
jgi:hypothetical protein